MTNLTPGGTRPSIERMRRALTAVPGILALAVAMCAGGGAGTEPTVSGDCPSGAFLDVASGPGAGAGYPSPTLSVSCAGDRLVVESNGIPHYTFVPMTPNPLVAQDVVVSLPLHPATAAAESPIPLLGTIGIAVNGIPIFGPNEAAMPANQAWGDPIYNAIVDGCLGHTAFVYHYHALVQKCLVASGLVSTPWSLADPSATTPSPILAYALDGYPIYGRYECVDAACSAVVERESSWERIGDPTTNAWDAYAYVEKGGAHFLDRCNGHVGPLGDYHYHETAAFPYVLGCYHGTPGTSTAVIPAGTDMAAASCHGSPDATAPVSSAAVRAAAVDRSPVTG